MDLLEIGRVGKPHGLRGDILVTISSDRPERTAPGAVWLVGERQVTVTAARPHQNRWVVHLEGIDSREAAEDLVGQVISAEPIDDPDAIWVHDIVGAELRTPDGRGWGTVVAVLANPADDLLELVDGTLVPAAFIVDSSGLPNHVVVEVPDGLLG